jgi:hypothetical protein
MRVCLSPIRGHAQPSNAALRVPATRQTSVDLLDCGKALRLVTRAAASPVYRHPHVRGVDLVVGFVDGLAKISMLSDELFPPRWGVRIIPALMRRAERRRRLLQLIRLVRRPSQQRTENRHLPLVMHTRQALHD